MIESSAARAGDFLFSTTSAGIEVYVLPTRKFKTRLLRVHARAELSAGNAARALVPNLARRGTKKLHDMVAVSRALEGLYGTHWSSSVYKLGHEHILSFRLDTVDERFLPGSPKVFAPALAIARELLFEPRLENGAYPPPIFEQERLNHRREIEAQYNDKMTWAFQRLLDHMFPGEPYGRPVLGTVAEADALTSSATVAAWREIIEQMPARVFAVGDFELAEVLAFVASELPLARAQRRMAPRRNEPTRVAPPRTIVEKDSVSQSKLVSGRLVNLENLTEREFDALRVYAGVLGGGFHSRLFQTIREKKSLAYFASASLDRLRGVLYTSCGIDAAHRQKVSELVEAEIASLRAAPPREDELEQTRRLMMSSSRGMFDSAGGMVETLEAGLSAGRVRKLDDVCRSLASLTAGDVQAAAARVGPPQVVFCLEGEARHDESETA